MRLIDWILGLFSKPKEEVIFTDPELAAWPFPVPPKKKRPQVKKATTRTSKKPAAKKTVAKKATKVAKKAK